MSNRVVARYRDGRIVKGMSLDVDAARPSCHVRPEGGQATEVALADLKALFFVRSLEGSPQHHESVRVEPKDPRLHGSTVVRLRFEDGEELVGLTNAYPPTRPFFFVVPVDRESNTIRILVNRAAVVAIDSQQPG